MTAAAPETPATPAYRPDQLLGARHDTPDMTGALVGFEPFGDSAPESAGVTPGQALSPDPAGFAYHVRATAFNVLTGKMPGDKWRVPRDERVAIARAVVDAVEPLIRADERDLAARQPQPAPGGEWWGHAEAAVEALAAALAGSEIPGDAAVRLIAEFGRRLGATAAPVAQPAPDLGAAYADLESEIRDVLAETRKCRAGDEPCRFCERLVMRAVRAVDAYARDVARHERTPPGLAAFMAQLAGEMHAEAQVIAPAGGEPDGMPDVADQVRAEVLHECAGRIRAGLPS